MANLFKATLTKFEFKREAFTKAFGDQIKLLMRNAAREFAKEAILHVPVQTGFARGALLNLTDAIGLNAATSPESFRRKLYNRRLKVKNVPINGQNSFYTGSGGRVPKTPDNARQFSTNIEKVFGQDGNKYIFNYGMSILYYLINDREANPHTPSSPWKSFEAGREAFINYINNNIKDKVPSISDYVVKTRISNG